MVLTNVDFVEKLVDDNHFLSAIEIAIVDKHDEIYRKGRELARSMYKKIWNTPKLIDGNDYAVVISSGGVVVANINIQVRSEDNLLKSEIFFGKNHWKNYLDIPASDLIEISGLCISDAIPTKYSRPVMMLLMMGTHVLHNSLGIRYLTTIQHEYLIRILQKGLNLPFFRNDILDTPLGEIPDDDYWKRDKMPKLYYLDGYCNEAIRGCASMFCYLNLLGLQMSFVSKVIPEDITYAALLRFWKGNAALN